MAKQESQNEVWVTIPQAAWLLGMTEGSFKHSEYYRAVPDTSEFRRSVGKARLINAKALIQAYKDKVLERAAPRVSEEDGLEGGMVTGSAALERYRDEMAQTAKIKRLELERTLVPRQEIRDGLGRLAGILKTAGEILGREYGFHAKEVLEDALKSYEAELERIDGDR